MTSPTPAIASASGTALRRGTSDCWEIHWRFIGVLLFELGELLLELLDARLQGVSLFYNLKQKKPFESNYGHQGVVGFLGAHAVISPRLTSAAWMAAAVTATPVCRAIGAVV